MISKDSRLSLEDEFFVKETQECETYLFFRTEEFSEKASNFSKDAVALGFPEKFQFGRSISVAKYGFRNKYSLSDMASLMLVEKIKDFNQEDKTWIESEIIELGLYFQTPGYFHDLVQKKDTHLRLDGGNNIVPIVVGGKLYMLVFYRFGGAWNSRLFKPFEHTKKLSQNHKLFLPASNPA